MIDWGRWTLLLYILMRMSGFVVFNPILGRRNFPGVFQAGMVLVLTWTVAGFTVGTAPMPRNLLEFALRLLLELALGYLVGVTMQLFLFLIPQQGGEILDSQMGMTMSKEYDPASQGSMSVTSTLLTIWMTLLLFMENGHLTLFRILLNAGDIVPYGTVSLGRDAANAVAELFVSCMLLAVKLALPILAAEMLGQIGMGILMKLIPQINVFAINIPLKMLIGMGLLVLFVAPLNEYLLNVERQMLVAVRQIMAMAR